MTVLAIRGKKARQSLHRPFRVVYQINTKNNYCKMFGNESNSANILHY
jgi:hypothetical protein